MAFWDLTKRNNNYNKALKIMKVTGKIDSLLQSNDLTYYDIIKQQHLIDKGPLIKRLARSLGFKLVKIKR